MANKPKSRPMRSQQGPVHGAPPAARAAHRPNMATATIPRQTSPMPGQPARQKGPKQNVTPVGAQRQATGQLVPSGAPVVAGSFQFGGKGMGPIPGRNTTTPTGRSVPKGRDATPSRSTGQGGIKAPAGTLKKSAGATNVSRTGKLPAVAGKAQPARKGSGMAARPRTRSSI